MADSAADPSKIAPGRRRPLLAQPGLCIECGDFNKHQWFTSHILNLTKMHSDNEQEHVSVK